MERFIIGRCRSGKTLTSHPELDGLASGDELFDVMAVFSLLAVRERRKNRDDNFTAYLENIAAKYARILSINEEWERQMHLIGAKTSLDVRTHALNLLRPEFKSER